MNLTKKNIQKTSGIHKRYKPGQLVTINNRIYGTLFIPSVSGKSYTKINNV